MKKLGITLLLLQFLALSAVAAPADPAGCSLCAGVAGSDGSLVPALVRVSESDLATLAPVSPGNVSVVVEYSVDPAKDALLDVETHTKQILDWARANGPFDSLGVRVTNADPALQAFAIKRLAVSAQGQGVAGRIIVPRTDDLPALFDNGANAYFDAIVAEGVQVTGTVALVAERDPAKKIFAVVDATSPNPLFDLGQAFAAGAVRAYATGTVNPQSLAAFNRSMSGDWAYDSTAKIDVLDAKGNAAQMPVLSFVRGEDLRTVLIARGDAAGPAILSLPVDRYTKPRSVNAAGERDITDTGRRGGRLLVGMPAAREPFAVLVDYAEKPDRNVTRETLNVATERGITVEEIIRNHQAYDAYQTTIEPRYIARNTTKLRFDIGGGADALEATIAGDYYVDPNSKSDWVWSEFLINGVKWKYGKIPELPLIQPEKVTQLPLDIHLSNEYRYELVRATDLLGYRVYEVRFEPPANAPAGLPLYRGTVFIDTKTWARIRIATVQLNLTGEVLSNEERVEFVPFARESKAPLDAAAVAAADPRSILWLPLSVDAQQVISAAGRASVIQRTTTFDNFRIDPPEFETLHAQVSASDARMIRETDAGMRYLEKRDGIRVVKEGFDTDQIFALGGIHHDDGLEFPVVPLGGIDYFNFNLFGKGIQTNVFFAGLVLAANATHPNVANTRTNIGVDFFGIAIPTENAMYRDGEEVPAEAVKNRPAGLFFRAGHPFAQFGKIDLSLGVSHQTYSRGDDTADDFIIPTSTFTFTPGIEVRYARRGYSFSASYDYNRRSTWEPWGDLAEYNPEQQSYTRFGASLGKSFYLPKFQRIGLDLNYVDGQRLDRFSKYELGFFGANRVHGVTSGSVHAERMIIGHLSYGFVFSQQFRLEAFYDHALVDDETSGYRRAPFQGIGIGGQTVGPWATLVRLDVGKMIGRNAQEGFVANVVFLKLF
ncbi:MAG TPA: hypothetical protein VEK57_05190 [Thermoanaerobaculia bacterium]|nr:hypothetical protein [Thermoanaerobaculia bacterium]